MRNNQKSELQLRGLLAIIASGLMLCVTGTAKADLLSAGVNLGGSAYNSSNGHSWAIFTTSVDLWDIDTFSGNVSISDINGGPADIGMAGSGKVDMSGNTKLIGDLYYHQPGRFTKSGNAKVTGTVHHDAASDTLLNNGVQDASTASDKAFALPATPGSRTTISTNRSFTLSGTGNVVLKLTDFVLSGGATLTLEGTATTAFIFNVTRTFSISTANVVLSGGLNANNVLFNIRGTGYATLSGNTNFNGIILATKRNVQVSGNTAITGEIISKNLDMSGGVTLKRPPAASH